MKTEQQRLAWNAYMRKWRKAHKSDTYRMNQYSADRIRFGGNRKTVLERDNYTCVKCGMTDEEHRRRFNRSITIDHIDNQGRYSDVKNNELDNLMTLCLPCHGRKDVLIRYERRK